MRCSNCGEESPAGFKFCGHCGSKVEGTEAVPLPAPVVAPAPAPTPARDERREVTVLFGDVSGFTAMSEKMDPEELHSLMNECFQGLVAAITEEGGYIDKFIGDNVMALFGAPVAHEDDPARACRAALDMQVFIRRFSEKIQRERGTGPLRIRIGIHSGLVLAGGVGSESRRDYSVMGDAVNLASRLESSARPGSVQVSEAIVKATRGLFSHAEARLLELKGKSLPVAAYELLGETPHSEEESEIPFVGRERELERIREWQSAPLTVSRHMDLHGEIGIGKTRMGKECMALSESPLRVRVTALATICRRPYGLLRRTVQECLKQIAGAGSLEHPAEFATALREVSPQLEPFEDVLWYLVAPTRLQIAASETDPEVLRQTLEQAVLEFFQCLGRRLPGGLLWIDSWEMRDLPSEQLIEKLMRLEPHPGFRLLRTMRSDSASNQSPGPHSFKLGELPMDACRELLEHLTEGHSISNLVKEEILRRAGGVPLFLEELVRSLIEQTPPAGDEPAAPSENSAILLPSSLRAAMVSRLDRLPGNERDFLLQCAVQGLEFDGEIAESVWLKVENKSAAGLLDALCGKQFIAHTHDSGSPKRYHFMQPLMHEACYRNLLRKDRRNLHGAIAESHCALRGGEEFVEPELLAHQYEGAENWAAAARAVLRAANRASELFLNPEALAGFQKVFSYWDRLSDNERLRESHLLSAAFEGSSLVYLRTGKYADAKDCVLRMIKHSHDPAITCAGYRILASILAKSGRATTATRLLRYLIRREQEGVGISSRQPRLHRYDLAEIFQRAQRHDEALEHLAVFRETLPADSDTWLMRADLLEGWIQHVRGHFDEAGGLYHRAYAKAAEAGSLGERARASNLLGNHSRDLGDYTRALGYYEHAMEIWTRTGDTECMAGVASNLGTIHLSTGGMELAETRFLESLASYEAIQHVNGTALALANLATLALETSEPDKAAGFAGRAIHHLEGAENRLLGALVKVILADALRLLGRSAEAAEIYHSILASETEATHPLALAGACRGKASLGKMSGDVSANQTLFLRAITLFQKLKRNQEEARTRMAYARSLIETGDPAEAKLQARSALELFEKIHAEKDLADAREFLQNPKLIPTPA